MYIKLRRPGIRLDALSAQRWPIQTSVSMSRGRREGVRACSRSNQRRCRRGGRPSTSAEVGRGCQRGDAPEAHVGRFSSRRWYSVLCDRDKIIPAPFVTVSRCISQDTYLVYISEYLVASCHQRWLLLRLATTIRLPLRSHFSTPRPFSVRDWTHWRNTRAVGHLSASSMPFLARNLFLLPNRPQMPHLWTPCLQQQLISMTLNARLLRLPCLPETWRSFTAPQASLCSCYGPPAWYRFGDGVY